MIGAIIGDIVGSRFEFENHMSKEFDFFDKKCTYTDDTVMTCAVADLMTSGKRLDGKTVSNVLQFYGRLFPGAGYGRKFNKWLYSADPKPYNSCGNGAAMRISPVGWASNSVPEVKVNSFNITKVTHDHHEGLKGAECIAMCVYLARVGKKKEDILDYARLCYLENDGIYKTCDQWREENKGCHGKEICQVSVPQAIACFREGNSYEDVIRNCVSIGGDTDTVAAIAGGVAEAYYGVPEWMEKEALKRLPQRLFNVVIEFQTKFCNKNGKNETKRMI